MSKGERGVLPVQVNGCQPQAQRLVEGDAGTAEQIESDGTGDVSAGPDFGALELETENGLAKGRANERRRIGGEASNQRSSGAGGVAAVHEPIEEEHSRELYGELVLGLNL